MAKSTARRHDSFYLRMGIGIGYGRVKSKGTLSVQSTSFSTFDTTTLDTTYDGLGPAYEILIGGTVARGLVVGGGIIAQNISNPRTRLNTTGSVTVSDSSLTNTSGIGVGAFGPFVDWFPDEHGGLHFGAMLGIGILGLENGNGDMDTGIAGALSGGYDFWIADQWSLGAEARAMGVSARRQFSDTLNGTLDDSGSSFELLFTALYH